MVLQLDSHHQTRRQIQLSEPYSLTSVVADNGHVNTSTERLEN